MRKRASGVAVAVIVLFASLVRAQAPAPAPGAPRTREVDPGVFNTSPVIDRAELRAGSLKIKPGGTRRQVLTKLIGATTTPGSPAQATLVGAGNVRLVAGQAGMLVPGFAPGGMVPGTGSGDHVPALLEPGEAVVPRYLVPLIAPILRSHHVPGFAAGGLVATPSGFSFTGTGSIAAEFAAALKQWAADIAKQTASQITTSINYARGVASAAAQGQGYGTAGLLGTFTATAGGPSGAGRSPRGPRVQRGGMERCCRERR